MLTARPTGPGWWSFVVEDAAGMPDATVDLDGMEEAGVLRLGDVAFGFSSTSGWISGRTVLTFGGVEVATAERRASLFRVAYDVRIQAGLLGAPEAVRVRLESSPANRRFGVRLGERALGEIRRGGFFARDAEIDVDDTLPLGVQAFLLALVVIEWRRAARDA